MLKTFWPDPLLKIQIISEFILDFLLGHAENILTHLLFIKWTHQFNIFFKYFEY